MVNMTQATPALSVVGVRIAFKGRDGLRMVASDVSFEMRPRARVSLIGESGAGKTVTALALCGLLDTHPGLISGQVILNGADLYSGLSRISREVANNGSVRIEKSSWKFQRMLNKQVRPVARKGIGLVFQEAKETLDPMRTVGDQLMDALRAGGSEKSRQEIEERARFLVRRLGFARGDEVLQAFPHELSGGMAQRIGIALALAAGPEVLIADEPTSALDAILQKQVADLLLDLHKEGNWALLMITHNLRLAEYLAETILVMYRGRVVEVLPAKLLGSRDEPLHPYTEQLRDASIELVGNHFGARSPNGAESHGLGHPTPYDPSTAVMKSPCPFLERCPRRNQLPAAKRDLCEKEVPSFRAASKSAGHWVRCWLFEEQ
jgi:peptide/nickel transport system ATP-binding protein